MSDFEALEKQLQQLKEKPKALQNQFILLEDFKEFEDLFMAFKQSHIIVEKQKLREQIITLFQLRAGNIGQIWDAGWAYGLLMLLDRAPRFKTREEYYEWAEKNVCRFHEKKDAEKVLKELKKETSK